MHQAMDDKQRKLTPGKIKCQSMPVIKNIGQLRNLHVVSTCLNYYFHLFMDTIKFLHPFNYHRQILKIIDIHPHYGMYI